MPEYLGALIAEYPNQAMSGALIIGGAIVLGAVIGFFKGRGNYE